MLQRIQTLYMLIVIFLLGIMFIIPLANFSGGVIFIEISAYKIRQVINQPFIFDFNMYYLAGTILFSILLNLITIFLFAKRRLQMKLITINIIINILVILYIFYVTDGVADILDQTPNYAIGSIFPLLSIVFLFLANRAIKKDDDLIKSADRLR